MKAEEISWRCSHISTMSGVDTYKMAQVRAQVFVLEQKCLYEDLDALDLHPNCFHVQGTKQDELVLYARVLGPGVTGESQTYPMIGRVLTVVAARGFGLGRELMAHCIKQCEQRWPHQPIQIGAQAHLRAFYSSLGFKAISEPYDEDGILHITMIREGPVE